MSATPFSIPFKNPYTLEEDIHFREYYSGEPLPYVRERVLGYTANQLIMGIQSRGQKEYKVIFSVSPDALQISCNCKSPKEVLCAHGYDALCELCWNSKKFFTIFEPGNLVSIALKNKNIFHINYANPDNFIIPDKSLGHLYDFEKIVTTEIEQIPRLTPASPLKRETETVWLLVYSRFWCQEYLPALVPVMGKYNKAGTNIKSFGKGFANINNESLLHTPDRKELYSLSTLMYSNRGDGTGLGLDSLLAGETKIADNFLYWEQALPMLSEQPFIYKFRLAHARYFMRNTPGRKYFERITVSAERPQLQFVLKDKGNYYQLSLQYLMRDKPIKDIVDDAFFFVCDDAHYYLLASLRDVAMVQWMNSYDNRISVLKPGFPLFEKEILQGIEAIYPVRRG